MTITHHIASLLLQLLFYHAFAMKEPAIIDFNFSHDIIDSATFVVDELREMSDSGIYQTLQLHQIHSAKLSEGIFHPKITQFELSLLSPHFASGNSTEVFQILVMDDKEKKKSFAIDEFPKMDPDAVETFWIQKVERIRESKKEMYETLMRESRAMMEKQERLLRKKDDIVAKLREWSDEVILRYIDEHKGDEEDDNVQVAKVVLMERKEEQMLESYSIRQLAKVTEDEGQDPFRRKVARRQFDVQVSNLERN